MFAGFFRSVFLGKAKDTSDLVLDAQFEPFREELHRAGLSEKQLLSMDPDDRVEVLEQAQLDPYDYIYLACKSI